ASGASSWRLSALSTIHASTSVATTTITAVRNLCHSCMRRVLFGIESLASCEPFFQPVPVCNLLLAQLPAEQDLRAPGPGGERDEAGGDVLDDRAALVDRVHAAHDFDPLVALRLLEPGDRAGVDAAAVARDVRRELLPFGLQPLLLATVRDKLLDER